jgi:hypothetical protein
MQVLSTQTDSTRRKRKHGKRLHQVLAQRNRKLIIQCCDQ